MGERKNISFFLERQGKIINFVVPKVKDPP
jgi:hypothetical protein